MSFDTDELPPTLNDWMEDIDLANGTEWTETMLAGEPALTVDVSNPLRIVRHVWAHNDGRTYAITLIFPTNLPNAQEDAEIAWQVVLETFEYLPRSTELS